MATGELSAPCIYRENEAVLDDFYTKTRRFVRGIPFTLFVLSPKMGPTGETGRKNKLPLIRLTSNFKSA